MRNKFSIFTSTLFLVVYLMKKKREIKTKIAFSGSSCLRVILLSNNLLKFLLFLCTFLYEVSAKSNFTSKEIEWCTIRNGLFHWIDSFINFEKERIVFIVNFNIVNQFADIEHILKVNLLDKLCTHWISNFSDQTKETMKIN